MRVQKLPDYYVYAHSKKSNGQVFYIGQGKGSRAWFFHGRNSIWRRIEAKHGVYVTILHDGLTREQALLLEREEIARLGRINAKTGILANLTDGGDGGLGLLTSEETKKKLSQAAKYMWSDPDFRSSMGEKRKGERNGMFGRGHTQEAVAKIKEKASAWSQQNREYIRNKSAERMADPSARAAASEKAKKRFANPEKRQQIREKRLAWAAQATAEQRLAGAFSPYAKAVICDALGLFYLCAKDAQKAGYGNVSQSARVGCKAKGHHWRYATPEEIAAFRESTALAA